MIEMLLVTILYSFSCVICHLSNYCYPCRPTDGPEPHYQGVVKGYEKLHSKETFHCHLGGILPEITLAYETYGELNADKSNAILLHTGLSASSHAKSHKVCCYTEQSPDCLMI
jgi:hypothetical protein